MAFDSIGYDGTVNEVQWGKLIAYTASSEYGVNYPTSFEATTVAGQSLMVKLSAGTAWTAGVVDSESAETTVELEPVLSGSRWDLIVIRRNWTPPGGATSIAVVKGNSARALPSRETARGVLEDQPLWLVRVDAGNSLPSAYVDLRVFARNGGCTANEDLVRSYMNSLGTMIEIRGKLWIRTAGSDGLPEWTVLSDSTDTGWVFGARSGTGWTTGGSDHVYSRRLGNLVDVRMQVTRNGPDISVPTHGDIPNMEVGQINTAHAPSFRQAGLTPNGSGRNASVYVARTGKLYLAAVSPGAPIRRGDVISASGTFFID